MKILEHRAGKMLVEIGGKYPTRILCNEDPCPLEEFKTQQPKPRITSSRLVFHSIRQRRPVRMDTQKYHRDIQTVTQETTEKLRLEIKHKEA